MKTADLPSAAPKKKRETERDLQNQVLHEGIAQMLRGRAARVKIAQTSMMRHRVARQTPRKCHTT